LNIFPLLYVTVVANAVVHKEIKMKYEYINLTPVETKKKTGTWKCSNNKSGDELGIVKWYAPWRQYCYFPTTQAVYSRGCLADITHFIESEMDKRKK
jgi:hypothetical protein